MTGLSCQIPAVAFHLADGASGCLCSRGQNVAAFGVGEEA
jgi:hypothetical protein